MKARAASAPKAANDWLGTAAQLLWWAIVGGGIALRVGIYLCKRGLSMDEARLALNVVDRSYTELLGRLDDAQVAPPLFLLFAKFVHGLWGQLEYSITMLPLVCSCLTLFLLSWLLSRMTSRFFGLCALCLCAFGYAQLIWATTFKQYACDEFSAAVVLLAALNWDRLSRRKVYLIAILLPGLVWLSYTSGFMLLGLVMVALVSALREGQRSRRIALAVLLCSMGLLCSSVYVAAARHSIGHGDMLAYWVDSFPERPYGAWLIGSLASVFGSASNTQYAPVLGFIICLWGTCAIARSKFWPVALVAAVALGAAVAASAFRVYPFASGRLTIYWAPVALVFLASGLEAAYRSIQPRRVARWVQVLAGAFVVIALYGLLAQGGQLVVKQEMRDVFEGLEQWHDPDTPIVVSGQAQPAFKIYGRNLHDKRIVWLPDVRLTVRGVVEGWLAAGQPERLWLVVSYWDFARIEEVLSIIQSLSTIKATIRHGESAAYLLELKPRWPPPAPETPTAK